MTLDLKVANNTLSGLRTYPVAITTVHECRSNGLMSLSAGCASIVPEAPRVTISITKYDFSHDLFLANVVAAEKLRKGRFLDINEAWAKLSPEWIEEYERDHAPQLESARRYRGLL